MNDKKRTVDRDPWACGYATGVAELNATTGCCGPNLRRVMTAAGLGSRREMEAAGVDEYVIRKLMEKW